MTAVEKTILILIRIKLKNYSFDTKSITIIIFHRWFKTPLTILMVVFAFIPQIQKRLKSHTPQKVGIQINLRNGKNVNKRENGIGFWFMCVYSPWQADCNR